MRWVGQCPDGLTPRAMFGTWSAIASSVGGTFAYAPTQKAHNRSVHSFKETTTDMADAYGMQSEMEVALEKLERMGYRLYINQRPTLHAQTTVGTAVTIYVVTCHFEAEYNET